MQISKIAFEICSGVPETKTALSSELVSIFLVINIVAPDISRMNLIVFKCFPLIAAHCNEEIISVSVISSSASAFVPLSLN